MAQNAKYIICPYCGTTQEASERCRSCGGLFEPLSRMATQIGMGPWFIRDKNNPYLPGCSYDVIKRMVESGRIKASTVIRGPTTHQFWAVARHVQGVSHLLGLCHACGHHLAPSSPKCDRCGEVFVEPGKRDRLGLQYASTGEAAMAQRVLARERSRASEQDVLNVKNNVAPGSSSTVWSRSTGNELLDEVFNETASTPATSKPAPIAREAVITPVSPQAEAARERAAETAQLAGDVTDFAASHDQPFVPSSPDETDEPAQKTNWSTAMLVGMNIIAVVLVVLLFYKLSQSDEAAAPTRTPEPAAVSTPQVNEQPSNTRTIRSAPEPAANVPDTPEQPPATDDATNESSAAAINSTLPGELQQLFVQVAQLQREGKLDDALTRLKAAQPTWTDPSDAEQIKRRIAELEDLIQRRQNQTFFTVPIQ